MHFFPILNVVGTLLVVLGGAQVIPLMVSVFYGEPGWISFLESSLGNAVIGGVLVLISRHSKEISERDGFLVVTLGWLAAALAGAMPYYLSGTLLTFTDAVFESMAGFTTTGASVFQDYASVEKGIFLWRSMTQWFGGMGIIVLALVILPALGIGGMQLYKREVPGPYNEKLTPRLRDTAKALWSVYVLITLLETGVLFLLGMTPFEAINHALTTVATGGFSTRGGSIAAFNSPAIEWAIIVFMFIAGMNFALHFKMLARPNSRLAYFKDTEWRWYVGGAALFIVATAAYLMLARDYSWFTALTKGAFQVISILSTTGYASDDYVLWGAFGQLLMVFAMIVGGCAGSTSGGLKWVRILLVFKYIYTVMLRLVHPKAVTQTKLNNKRVSEDILSNIFALIFLFFSTLAVTTLLLALDGHSMLTSFGAALSALGNVGPGLDAVGPTENYMHLSAYAKWVLTLAMLMGRLELMTVFVLFMPSMWRR